MFFEEAVEEAHVEVHEGPAVGAPWYLELANAEPLEHRWPSNLILEWHDAVPDDIDHGGAVRQFQHIHFSFDAHVEFLLFQVVHLQDEVLENCFGEHGLNHHRLFLFVIIAFILLMFAYS